MSIVLRYDEREDRDTHITKLILYNIREHATLQYYTLHQDAISRSTWTTSLYAVPCFFVAMDWVIIWRSGVLENSQRSGNHRFVSDNWCVGVGQGFVTS